MAKFKGDASMQIHDNYAVLALQGPKASKVLQKLTDTNLSDFFFGNFREMGVAGVSALVTRTGFTGEDGFEIFIPNHHAEQVAASLMLNRHVRLSGIIPRYSSLRIEAGLARYGYDISEDVTPIEASLGWTVGHRRREKFDFLGGDFVKKQLMSGAEIKRVGFMSLDGFHITEGAMIMTKEGGYCGKITSSAFSATLNKHIAMGYVFSSQAQTGTQLKANDVDVAVAKMPFVDTKYYR